MTLPPILPDWVPWWAQLALLVLALLFAVAFLMMPFAVFGLKGRLDLLEAQLDDIHAELRMLAMRLPEAEPVRPQSRRVVVEPDEYEDEPAAVRRPVRMQDRTHPLRADNRIQPRDPPRDATRDAPRDATRDDLRDRSEPRLRWPPASERR